MIVPPWAHQQTPLMKTRGPYPGGGPRGAIVHFTAGRGKPQDVVNQGVKDGYAYWCVGRDGLLVTAHSAEMSGAHSGKSTWKGLRSPVHLDLIGIEVIAAGICKRISENVYRPWYNEKKADPAADFTALQVRYTNGAGGYPAPGFYHMFTKEQEATLIETLIWLAKHFEKTFRVEYVLGHDEVSPGRKTDPGAALSMGMKGLRELLKKELAK